MIGIFVISHGNFSKEIIRSAEVIVGKQENVDSLSLFIGDDPLTFEQEFVEKVQRLERGKGVLVFADILGGTPSNISAKNLKGLNYELITGINMAMLIEALLSRNFLSIKELKDKCVESAHKSINDMRKIFNLEGGNL